MRINTLKRFLATTLSVAMIFSGSAMNVFAQETNEIAVDESVVETVETDDSVATTEAVIPVVDVRAEGESYNIEINQGFSLYESKDQKDSENYNYQNDFVASKATIIAIEVADGKDISNWELTYNEVVNGEEKGEAALTWKGNEFDLVPFYDKDSNEVSGKKMAVVKMTTGPAKGTYTFHLKDGSTEIAKNEKVNFFETKTLNILAVPVISYYGSAITGDKNANQAPHAGKFDTSDTSSFPKWNGIDGVLKKYLKKVYPVADINIEVGQTLDLGEEKYDLANGEGDSQRNFWEECNKLQVKDKDTGKDKYDLILAFVPYRQDANATGQGYTFGKPTNIITLMDDDMLPTVAHEIAHCYSVGDEYNGGSYNARVNDMPLGYNDKARDKETGNEINSSDAHLQGLGVDTNDYHWVTSEQYKTNKAGATVAGMAKENVDGSGNGSVIYPTIHPYDLENSSFISFAKSGDAVYPTISYMGSGYSGDDGYYYTTSVIWNHLFKELMVKEKNTESNEGESSGGEESGEQATNASIFLNSGTESMMTAMDEGFELGDFYYDDNYREGASRMIEVSGTISYADKVQDAAISKVEVDPMFSYEGDLEYMEFLEKDEEETIRDNDLFFFMALDKDGKVIESPVDGEKSVFEFYGGNYNSNMQVESKRFQTFAAFSFDAEYPEGTERFAIVRKADYKADATYEKGSNKILWEKETPDRELVGDVLYADVDSNNVQIDYAVTAYDENGELDPAKAEDLAKIRNFYTKIYYAPLGDEGQTYFVKDGTLGDFYDKDTDCYSWKFDPTQFGANNADAYVWVKVSDGVNGADMFSDDVNVSIVNSTVSVLKGAKGKNEFKGLKVFNYTGSEIEPKVKVKVKDLEAGKTLSLVEGRDYVLSYSDNVNAGIGTIKIKGIGEFTGTSTQFFGIKAQSLKSATLGALPSLVYSVSTNKVNKKDKNVTQIEIESYLDATLANNDLTVDKDYYPTYAVKDGKRWPAASKSVKTLPSLSANFIDKDYVDVRVYVNGKANYTGRSAKFATVRLYKPGYEVKSLSAEVADNGIELSKPEMSYTGKKLKPVVRKVKLKDGTTLAKKYYSVIYTNNKNIGKATVKVVGKNGYFGTVKTTFEIKPAKVNKLTVSKLPNVYYTGKAISVNEINITVKAGKFTLKRDVDYTVSLNGIVDAPTTKEIKTAGNMPTVTINLINEKVVNGKTVAHVLPVDVVNKTATKSFAILPGRYSSNALASVVLDSVSANGIKGLFSRNSEKKLFKNYAYVLDVGGEEIAASNDAKGILNMKVKVAGKTLSKDAYDVAITRTPAGKVGKIIITPKDTTKFTGKRIIKFKNIKPQD